MKTHISSDLWGWRERAILIAIILIVVISLVILASTNRAGAEPTWHFEAAAQANCAADNLTANVGWVFRNTDTRTMRVSIGLADGTNVERDIPAGAIDSGTFARPLPLVAGSVRFVMRWLDQSGTDSATRGYEAVASCAPTAVQLSSFAARPAAVPAAPVAGNRDGCAPGNRWPGVQCVVTDFRPGFVSGTCGVLLWFRDVRTCARFGLISASR